MLAACWVPQSIRRVPSAHDTNSRTSIAWPQPAPSSWIFCHEWRSCGAASPRDDPSLRSRSTVDPPHCHPRYVVARETISSRVPTASPNLRLCRPAAPLHRRLLCPADHRYATLGCQGLGYLVLKGGLTVTFSIHSGTHILLSKRPLPIRREQGSAGSTPHRRRLETPRAPICHV